MISHFFTPPISAFRRSKSTDDVDMIVDECCAPIRDDYEKRHND